MIINSDILVTYRGDGTTVNFPFSFPFAKKEYICVKIKDETTGSITKLDSDYFVDEIGSKVVYPGYEPGEEPPEEDQPPKLPATSTLTIYRNTEVSQLIELGEKFPLPAIEGALDKITEILQEQANGIARAMKVDETSSTTPDEYMQELIDASAAAVVAAANAAISETNAGLSATAAGNSATAAHNSELAAASSATAAGNSATAAHNSELAAASSETNAGNSATAAGNSATAAHNSELAAASSETNAGNSATAAGNSATAAHNSELAAEAAEARIADRWGLRKKDTLYAAEDMAYHTDLPTGWYLECTTPGTTSANELVITSPSIGDTITDGTVVWEVCKVGNADIPLATDETDGLMSAADKAKLDTINISADGSVTTKTHRWGIRIDKRNSDPATRCEYIFDAKGMGPAGMDFANGVFNYGDWADMWFVKNNKPCMLKSDGTVDYYLDPNDYSKKEDGTASDVGNASYDGNAMAEIPLVWVKRWEDGRYEYEVISDIQYDETYHAYAHTRADGTIADKFYFSMFGGSGNATKIRSLSGQSLSQSLTTAQQISGATANGSGWYIHTWSQRELIRTLCVLMGCSTDTQSVFGNGNCRSASSASGMLTTGTIKDKGQFFGYSNSTDQVKVFHIEKFWGDQWDRVAGLINNNGRIYAKMTPEGDGYRVTDVTGYTDTGLTAPAGSGSYINGMHCDEHGMIPSLATGSSTTYYCDGYWTNNGQLNYLIAGASAVIATALGGAFAFLVNGAPAAANWDVGCGLSYL